MMENATDVASGSRQLRHRRRPGRSQREQTPDASRQVKQRDRDWDDDEQSQPQVVSMQIRPPGAMSAHESKILRRRDKNFAGNAARSQSQPREAEKLSSPDANQLIKHRSLSSPRHKEMESSESELTGSSQSYTAQQQQMQRGSNALTRLEQNMLRFEDERRRFDAEKRLFEREKREHKLRHRQQLDHEERKRLLQNYRKISDGFQLPQDEEERRRLVQSLRLQRNEAPTVRLRNRSSGYEESSTQFSSSDADTAEEQHARLKPTMRKVTAPPTGYIAAPIRGAPPPPPTQQVAPKPPERRSVSRNNSLSPVRPQRRSKTPEQRAAAVEEFNRKQEYVEVGETPLATPLKPKLSEEEQRAELRRAYVEAAEKAAAAEAALARSLGVERVRRSNSLKVPQESEQKTQVETKRSSSLERPKRSKRTPSLERPKLEEVLPETQPESSKELPAAEETTAAELQPLPLVTEQQQPEKKPSLLQRLSNLFRRKQPIEELVQLNQVANPEQLMSRAFLRHFRLEAVHEWRRLKLDYPVRMEEMRKLRNECIGHLILLMLLLGFGGLLFRYTEGASEDIYKCEVRKVKRDFIEQLWTFSHNLREDDWKSLARQKLRKFEDELNALAELGLRRFPGQKSFNFVNCIIYCWTVITTIGYGHITPKSYMGRILTIVYAIIGIPLFLIVLADLGKLFTRSVKFLWVYVRRIYYTRSCRRIRKQQQFRDAMTGINTMYDMARRPSMFFGKSDAVDDEESRVDDDPDAEAGKSLGTSHPETPTSPYPETFEVDDEFNLPISVATLLLVTYIILGSLMYAYILEPNWKVMDAFYFVFISMSTIGFGDMVPSNPFYVMLSMIYLIFGLALTSMFINVVQIKLSDHFKAASAKVGATIGMGMASEYDDGSQIKTPSEMASVHGSRLGRIEEDGHESRGNGAAANSRQQPPLTSILRPPRPLSPATTTRDSPPPLAPRRPISPPVVPVAEAPKKKYRFF
ncbi:trichohyalin isoform X1 [Drosophila albomicans]|uniref:Trichohyalin isoform X1 n=1 Tax=Drosophila albomicans TaxID=7291 RepID=A0A9C6WIA3_DROAB|nr:trichohyalin isoform X1 [Drosophila albomicans]